MTGTTTVMNYYSEITAAMEAGRTLQARVSNGEKHLRWELHLIEKRECDLRRSAALEFAKQVHEDT